MSVKDKKDNNEDFIEDSYAISAMECTGLMPTPPLNEGEWEAYQALYATELTSGADTAKHTNDIPDTIQDKNP